MWGSLQGAQAVCKLMGVSLGMAEQLCASLQALRDSPKSHDSVPEVCIIWLIVCMPVAHLADASALHFAPSQSGVASNRGPFSKGPSSIKGKVFTVFA